MTTNLLLVSNTKVHNGSPFDHARGEIEYLFSGLDQITFLAYARPGGITYEEYAAEMEPTFTSLGKTLKLIGEENPIKSIQSAEAIYLGGGNTWELLRQLKDKGLLYHIREAVNQGVPYLGSSAGSNVAGLTVGNTNDMPAAESHGRDALALVPFNINPHYQDPVNLPEEKLEAVLEIAPELRQTLTHQGETREKRIREYHLLGNSQPVVALREGSMLKVTDSEVYLKGMTGGVLFMPGKEAQELEPNANLDFLLD